MTAEAKGATSGLSNSKARRIPPVLLLLTAASLCIAALVLYEAYPRFIRVPLSLPNDDYGAAYWGDPAYTVQMAYGARRFILTRSATLVYKTIPDEESRGALLQWFDQHLEEHGWYRTGDWTTCRWVLPQAQSIIDVQDFSTDGYVSYRRRGFIPALGMEEEDLVCIAIWSGDPGVFSLEMATSKPSPLMMLYDVLGS